MPDGPESVFEKELTPGEALLWCGQPQPGIFLRRSELVFIPLSLVLCGLAVGFEAWLVSMLWQVINLNDQSPTALTILVILSALALIGLPFVLLGLFLLFGRYEFDRLRRRKTFYALTNRRIIIASTLLKPRFRSIPLDKQGKINLALHPNGRGSLFLNGDVYLWWVLVGPPWWIPFWPDVEVYQPPFLERIESPVQVYEKIQQLIKPA